ncbi:MAG: outer membrane beta-barrel protein [Ahrensia sp.]
MTASTALMVSQAAAQTTNDLLRGSTNNGVGNAPGLQVRTAGTTSLTGQLKPGEVVQGQGQGQGQQEENPLAQEALDAVLPANPFEESEEEEEEAAARETPQSRLGPVQAFPEREDEDEEDGDEAQSNNPFDAPFPDPAEPLTREELERERLETLRRVRASEAVGPTQTGLEIEEEENPYEAIGLEVGTFTLRPTLDVGIAGVSRRGFIEIGGANGDDEEADDRPTRIVADDESGTFGQLDLNLAAESNWSRHSLSVEANARFQEGIRGDAEAEPEFGLVAEGVLDIDQQTTLTGELDYSFVLEEASSANAQLIADETINAASTPSEQTIAGLLTLGHDSGNLFGDITVGATRTLLGEVDLGDGSIVEQSDNDNTLYIFGLRGGFRASPVFRPFAEAQLGWRFNDEEVDGGAFARNSQGYTLRLGTEIDLGDKLSGEISAGYVVVDYDDTRLESLGGVSLAAELDWEPRRGTQVGFILETNTEPSGVEGVSGSIAYAGEASLTQQIRRNLTATVNAGLEYTSFNAIEEDTLRATAGLGFTYWMNRNMGLVGNYSFERTTSDDQSNEQTNNSVFLGLRFQR